MAMGKKKRRQQKDLWVATSEMPVPAGHPFYVALEDLLKKHQFDDFVERRCAQFYAPRMGRPSLEPGVYFRLLLVGYFEGLGSERGIAWRAADSLALREFLGLKLSESPPDHSTLSRTRRLIDVQTHAAVFDWVLQRVGEAGLLKERRWASMRPRWKPMPRCAASFDGIAGKGTTSFSRGWLKRRESKRRPAKSW